MINERFLYALKERGGPGFYWGLLVAAAFCSLLFLFRISEIWIVGVPTIIGVALGGLLTFWWREGRSYADRPAEKNSREWRIFPFTFAGLGGLLVGALTLLMLLGSRQPNNDYWAIFGAVVFLGNYGLAGALIGSLSCLAAQWSWSWWNARRPKAQPRPAPSGRFSWTFNISPRLYERLYGWRRGLIIANVVVIALIIVGVVWLLSGGSLGGSVLTPTPTATIPPQATATAQPSPTRPPTETRAPTASPTQPPTATVIPPTVVPATATATTRAATPTRPRAPASLTPTCTYTTRASDTWKTAAQELGGVDIGALMRKNPGANPAQSGTILKSPRAGCP